MTQNNPQLPLQFGKSGPRQFVQKAGDYVWSFALLTGYGLVVATCIAAGYLGIRLLIFVVRLTSRALGLGGD